MRAAFDSEANGRRADSAGKVGDPLAPKVSRMNVLGIQYRHNATVCLVQDGEVTFAQSEERLNRIKNSLGFPAQTLEHVYDTIVRPEEIDLAVLFQTSPIGYVQLQRDGFRSVPFELGVTKEAVGRMRYVPEVVNDARWFLRDVRHRRLERSAKLRAEITNHFSRSLRVPATKLRAVRHHDAHAYAAVPNLGTEQTLIFTLDGSGDDECATVQLWDDRALQSLSRTHDRHSLGFYYAYTTAVLGMRASEHEFKVMGLAPYADPSRAAVLADRLRTLIDVRDGEWSSKVHGLAIAAALEREYRFERFDTIAGAIQLLAEQLVLAWIRHWVGVTGCRKLALGGGVFMNVKIVQLIAELDVVDQVFVVPSAGDESCAIGAAVHGHLEIDPATPLQPIGPLDLGIDVTDSEIEAAVISTGASERYDITDGRDPDAAAALLASGEVLARCVGRSEYGARALGNRSILADPSRPGVAEHINRSIKNRDFWMPFAPSILQEEMDNYVVRSHETFAPHMTITYPTTSLAQEHMPAAVHPRDRTARPQEVVKAWHPEYHALISRFQERTGIGAVLNTSFNLHGEPNVGSAVDAITTVDRSGLRHLVLGQLLLTKR